jgi:cytochrome o ubiquinol oxidase operon protein cyoD
MRQKTLLLRFIGYAASLILTLSAYLIIVHPDFFHLEIRAAIVIIFILALLQSNIQLIFFLDLWREKGPRWNLAFFVSTLGIITLIIAGSIWIMNHLNYNMMEPLTM